MIAQVRPPPSLPAKRLFFLVIACGLMARCWSRLNAAIGQEAFEEGTAHARPQSSSCPKRNLIRSSICRTAAGPIGADEMARPTSARGGDARCPPLR